MKIISVIKEDSIIREAFDTSLDDIGPLRVIERSPYNHHYEFRYQGRIFEVEFERYRIEGPSIWMLDFYWFNGRDRKQNLSSEMGNVAISIYALVMRIVEKFIGDEAPGEIRFDGAVKRQDGLYRKILQNQTVQNRIARLGYKINIPSGHGEISIKKIEGIKETNDPSAPTSPPNVMVVVHPGSCCGSADFNLGYQTAEAYRTALQSDLDAWNGPLVVIHGELSDELPRYPALNSALQGCMARATQQKQGWSFVADDNTLPPHPVAFMRFLKRAGFPKGTWFRITGAWHHRDDSAGCVNSIYDAAQKMGYNADVRDSAFDIDGDDPDDDYEDED